MLKWKRYVGCIWPIHPISHSVDNVYLVVLIYMYTHKKERKKKVLKSGTNLFQEFLV